MARPAELIFPAFPFSERSYTNGGPIPDLPLAAGLDNVWSVLLTSDELMPDAQHFGALRRECLAAKCSALHALLSVAQSQRANRAEAFPGWEGRARAQMIVRSFVPDPHNNPRRFAVLLSVVVGAKWVVHNPSEPNLSRCEGPPPRRALPDGEAKAPEEAEAEDGGSIWAALVAAQEPASSDPMGKLSSVLKPRIHNTVVAITDIASWVRDIYNHDRLHRFVSCTNIHQLLPESFVEPHQRRRAQGKGRMEPEAKLRPWDLVHHVSRVGEVEYLRGVLGELALWPSEVLAGEQSTDAAQAFLSEDHCAILRSVCTSRFGFSDVSALTEMRVALSLPNALYKLSLWLGGDAAPPTHRQWCNMANYVHVEGGVHATPRGCTTVLLAAKADVLSLRSFLLTELPSVMTAKGMLQRPDVQLALLRHPLIEDKVRVYQSALALNLNDDGKLWLGRVREHLDAATASLGNLHLQPTFATTESLMAFVSRHIYDSRRLATEVGAVCTQLEVEIAALINPGAAQGWENQRLQAHCLASFNAFAASRVDSNTILGMVHAYFEGGAAPEGVPMPQHIDLTDELVNYRNCFARRLYSDLTNGAAFLATMGVASRVVTNLIEYGWHAMFTQIVLACSWLDYGERVHIQHWGTAATGKTSIIQGAVKALPPGAVLVLTYSSDAAMRDSDPTAGKNVALAYPEWGSLGEHSGMQSRTVDLSRMTEDQSFSRTVAIDADGNRRIVTTPTYNRWSLAVATNLPVTDPAFKSRLLVCHVQPLGLPGSAFGEVLAGDTHHRAELEPLRVAYTRALHFFWRCVMAYCMMSNAGVVPRIEVNPLSIAIINRMLPDSTDASDIRTYKQLYTMASMVTTMLAVHQFLSSPESPLTVVHGDRISLASLMDVRFVMRPMVQPALFVSSATPFLNDDPVMRSVVRVLLQTALSIESSSVVQWRRDTQKAYDELERSEPNPATRRSKQEHMHLDVLSKLFPEPRCTRPPAAARADDTTSAEEPVSHPPNAVFFSVDKLVHKVTLLDTHHHKNAEEDEGQRAIDRHFDEEAGFVPDGVPMMPGGAEQWRDSRVPARPAPKPALVQRAIDAPDAFGPLVASPLQNLRGQDSDRAMRALVDELCKRVAGEMSGPVADTGAGTAARVNKVLSNTRRATGESADHHKLRERIQDVLGRLHIRFYQNGWAAVNARCLDIDTNARVQRSAIELMNNYDVEEGGYLIFDLMHVGGVQANEAMRVIPAVRNREADALKPRVSFDALIDTHNGFSAAAHKLKVAQRLFAGGGAPLPVLHRPSLSPAVWRESLKQTIARAGIEHDSTTAAVVRKVLSLSPRTSTLVNILSGNLYERAPVAADMECVAVALARAGVGVWQPGQISMGVQRPYHDVESDPDEKQAPRPLQRSVSKRSAENLEEDKKRDGEEVVTDAESEAVAPPAEDEREALDMLMYLQEDGDDVPVATPPRKRRAHVAAPSEVAEEPCE